MGKKQRLFPKASMVHTPSKDFRKKSKSMVLTCPTHQIVSPWESDHFPKSESTAIFNTQPGSTQFPFHYSSKTASVPPPLPWQKHQTTSTGPLPSLKYQGKIRSLLPKKYHNHNFGLTIPTSNFRPKASVGYPTSSKQFVLPSLVSVHQSKSSVKLKQNLRGTSGTNSVPKISSGRSHQSKQKLKQKSSKTMKEPLVPPWHHSSTSSVPASQRHASVHHQTHSRRRKIAAALFGGLDLWPKDIIIKLPSPEVHCNTKDTEKKSDQPEPTVQPHPETPPLLKLPFSKKERPPLTPTETAVLSLTFNKSRDKLAPSSYTKFISRGTNTYMPWPQNKSTLTGFNHQIRLNARPASPDFMHCARTKSVPSLPLKIWETSKPQNIVTKLAHVGEASPGPDCKVKNTFGPSSHPVCPFIQERNESGEIPPTDPTKDLYHWSESSKGQGQSDSPSMSQSNDPEASTVSKPPSGTVLAFLKESTPTPGLLDKSSLIAGDQRSRDPFGLDQQVKSPICHHAWLPPSIFSEQPPESIIGLDFQAVIELDSQPTHELKPDSQDLSQSNPNDQAISPPIKDNQSEPAPDEKVQGMPDHQVSQSPSTDKLDDIESKSTIAQEEEDQVTQNSPVVNPKESVTPSSGDEKDSSSGNGHYWVKVGLNSDSRDEAKSGPQKQNQSIQNRDIPWRLKYIKPYTIKGGQVSAQTVNAIVNSIPEKKIKSDMCKQILMRRMKESPPHRPGQRIPLSYTVCLECASWIPNGCPHTEGMNRLSETELLVIPIPLPGSEEMGVKFILKVPHKKKPFSFFSMLFPEYEIYWPPQQSSDLPSPSDNETCGCPKVIQLQPSSPPPGTEPCECPQVTLFDLIVGKDRCSSEKKPLRCQLPHVEELPIGSEDDGKELLRVLSKG
ncbi:uncharacterized protein LOC141507045 isoform X2 [Macrotis lagotis]|uniref:uncharacterized protein LOC141507045 isoform X2 n=1 Tax=Macrotis lagotis TaxID=92651 RepID=UPI003D69A828